MRILWSATALWATLASVSVVVAETNQTELAEATAILNAMPECGRTCLLNEIVNSSCALTDIECSCNSKTIVDRTTLCVMASCTIKQQLTTKNSTETLCHHPIRDKRTSAKAGVVAGTIIAGLAYVLRLASKIQRRPSGTGWTSMIWWDDAVMGFAVAEMIACTAIAFVLNENGLGTDIWTIPFPHITNVLHIYYYAEDLYLTALPAVKISLLLTYLRIFPKRDFRIAAYIVIGLNVAYAIVFVLISVFQCWPIPMAWERWHGEYQGKCNDINAQSWASAALNVILDVVTLSLPLPLLWKMQLNKRKKFWVMLMFCVGFFVTVVSIIRLQVLVKFGASQNFTWDYTAVGYWSTVELYASVVCASMPALRNLLRKFAPKLMGNTSAQTPGPSMNNGSRSRKSAAMDVQIRTVDSDEENFIPLEAMMANHSAPLPPVGKH